ncbi:MAG: DNA polymerase III subunit gamma/tau [Solirubrobacterales bacterium]
MASLYRRHRPRSFDDVVGQEHVVRTLRNAVDGDQVHHAYLFVGSRGTGKTSMAKILASAVNCRERPGAGVCGECESCRTIADGTSLDVIEMDAASNRSVDDIRDLRERVGYAPAVARSKLYILDEAHMLTKEAWNAFLKTLEEPPPNTIFILATTEAHKVMPTIVDRCQRFDFQRPSIEQVNEVLARVAVAETIDLDEAARTMIARAAAGSFRDALGTLDQLVSYGGAHVDYDAVLAVLGVADAEVILEAGEALAEQSPERALAAVDAVDRSGRDLPQFGRDLMAHLRHLLVQRATGSLPESFAVTSGHPVRLRAQAEAIAPPIITRAIDELSVALREVREGADARVMIEVALLKAARPQLDASLRSVLDRLDRLEAGLQQPPAPAPPSAPTPPSRAPAVRSAPEPARGDDDPAAPAGDSSRTDPPAPPPAHQPPLGPEAARPPEPPPEPERHEPPAPSVAPVADPGPGPKGQDRAAGNGHGDLDDAAPATEQDAAPVAPVTSISPPTTQPTVDIERAQDLWPAVVEHLHETGSMVLASSFQDARPVALADGELVVGFPEQARFNRRKAETRENQAHLAEALQAVLGVQLRPVYAALDTVEEAMADEVDEDELIERIKETFDAQEIIEPEAGASPDSEPPATEPEE